VIATDVSKRQVEEDLRAELFVDQTRALSVNFDTNLMWKITWFGNLEATHADRVLSDATTITEEIWYEATKSNQQLIPQVLGCLSEFVSAFHSCKICASV
jgi:hypothetical protein